MEPYLALVILVLLGILGYFAGKKLGAVGTRAQSLLVFGSLGIFAVNQWIQVFPEIETTLFPFPFYIYLSNWAIPCVGIVAGAAMARVGDRGYFIKRIALLTILCALAVASTAFYVFPEIPPASDEPFSGYVCRQSDDSTCAPAAVATYLGLLNIRTTELEAARLALTRADEGSGTFGIWRALSMLGKRARPTLKARARRLSLDELLEEGNISVIRVELKRGVDRDAYNEPVRSWAQGIAHAMVYLGWDGEGVFVADPSSGQIQIWGLPEFEVMWDGYVFYLEENGEPVSAVKSPVPWLSAGQSPPG